MDTPWPYIAMLVALVLCGLKLYGSLLPPENCWAD